MKFLAAGCFTGSKPFDFGADPDYDPDPGIFPRRTGVAQKSYGSGTVARRSNRSRVAVAPQM